MTAPTLPTDQLEHIMECVTINLRRIDPGNDPRFATRTLHCDQVDIPLRPEDVEWPTDAQGTVLTVEDTDEYFEFLTASRIRSRLTYEVVGWIYSHDPTKVKWACRKATKDLWVAFWYDYHLHKADSQVSGLTGVRLVSNHRIERIERQYRPPEAFYRATVTCIYDFQADAAE